MVERKNYQAIKNGIEQLLKIVGGYATVKSEIDVNVRLRAVISTIVPVVSRYVPENLRNECADALEAAIN